MKLIVYVLIVIRWDQSDNLVVSLSGYEVGDLIKKIIFKIFIEKTGWWESHWSREYQIRADNITKHWIFKEFREICRRISRPDMAAIFDTRMNGSFIKAQDRFWRENIVWHGTMNQFHYQLLIQYNHSILFNNILMQAEVG